jgi:hypothetical protein
MLMADDTHGRLPEHEVTVGAPRRTVQGASWQMAVCHYHP